MRRNRRQQLTLRLLCGLAGVLVGLGLGALLGWPDPETRTLSIALAACFALVTSLRDWNNERHL